MSSIDADFICSKNIDVIPLGVAIQRPLNERVRSFPPVVSFTGNMNYQPNVDAVLWFVQHCWKEIKKESPGVRLVVAGNEPQLSIKTLSDDDPSIMVTGRVPSIADILNKSTVAVAPMRSGSGMQFKILEAMACGVPVVATTLGLGDISAINGQDIIIADNPNDFARQVVRLIKNADINKMLVMLVWYMSSAIIVGIALMHALKRL
ncbi:glycosyltransferase [Chromobacterium haemolyticum]|uniref:glycosyltransferase n=1 Tax=Chromobacterium haemolyticum TaxID=394935 RepID=UPI0029554F83|nr:glycosyltransferase [Chromobacterium haemolyticum]WON82830.1 glycosyltransferase family 4 protein [Chromobacterium haemolyticum]